MYLANVKITHILFTIIDCKYIIKLNKFKMNKYSNDYHFWCSQIFS